VPARAADPGLLRDRVTALEEVVKFALREPARIEIGRTSAVTETVNHAIHTVIGGQKFALLLALLQRPEFKSVLIFSRTKHGADHLAHLLRLANHSVAVLHANRTQPQRVAALAGFKSGQHGIMVATDIAARGIDVAGVSHVINYDVPQNPRIMFTASGAPAGHWRSATP